LSIDFHSGLMKNNSHLLHNTVTFLVNIQHVGNR